MRVLLFVVCCFMIGLLAARCWTKSEDRLPVTETADTSKVFSETLRKFQDREFITNKEVSMMELEEMGKPYLKYHSEPIEAMYIFLGAETPQKP